MRIGSFGWTNWAGKMREHLVVASSHLLMDPILGYLTSRSMMRTVRFKTRNFAMGAQLGGTYKDYWRPMINKPLVLRALILGSLL